MVQLKQNCGSIIGVYFVPMMLCIILIPYRFVASPLRRLLSHQTDPIGWRVWAANHTHTLTHARTSMYKCINANNLNEAHRGVICN